MHMIHKLLLPAIFITICVCLIVIDKNTHRSSPIRAKDTINPTAPEQATKSASAKVQITKSRDASAFVPKQFNLENYIDSKSVKEDELRLIFEANNPPAPEKNGALYSWSPFEGYNIRGTVDSIAREADSYSFGVNLENNLGRFVYFENSGCAGAVVFFNNREGVHRFSHSVNNINEWTIEEIPFHNVVCASAGTTYPMHISSSGYPRRSRQKIRSANNIASFTQHNTSNLYQSKPGAPTVIYCNFEGELVNQPFWSDSIINAAPSGLSIEEVLGILEIVAEDFAPFDVNVTNDRAIYDNKPPNKRVMCISTPTKTVAPNSGGIAGLGTFIYDIVCWDFNLDGDTISHEVGHTLNLYHHGDNLQSDPEYHDGHPSNSRRWAPIMGAGNAGIVQWSDGNYSFATNSSQDDLNIITNYGLSYREDDYGNNNRTGEDITVGNNPVAVYGIIERSTDIDVFNVSYTSYGRVKIGGIGSAGRQSNLDVRMTIEDSSGTMIYEETDDLTDNASTERLLLPGFYKISIQGDSSGNPNGNPATGWSSYGSLGQYQLSFLPDPPTFYDAIDQYSAITLAGDADWAVDYETTYDGTDAVGSGTINKNQSSEFIINKQTTSVSFWYKVSSESGYDLFEFLIDGQEVIRESGEIEWTQFNDNSLTNTAHTFKWRYSKDGSVDEGSDKAWVDQVSFDQNGGYNEWSRANVASNSGTVDNDGDGIIDLIEYLTRGSYADQGGSLTISLDSDSREFTLRRDSANADLVIRLLVSENLEDWAPKAVSYAGASFSTISGFTATDSPLSGSLVETKITFPTNYASKKFAQLEIVLKKKDQ